MPLTELFIALLKENELSQALSKIQEEIESRYGVLSDEDKIEDVFFEPDENGLMSGTNVYKDCMTLFSFLKGMDVPESPMTDFFEELSGWSDGYAVERLEAGLDKAVLEKLEGMIDKINEIPSKKKLLIYKNPCKELYGADESGKGSELIRSCDLSDYKDGRFTFADMKVRRLLMENMSESTTVMVLVGSPAGEYCLSVK